MKLSELPSSFPLVCPSGCLLLLVGNSRLHWGWLPPQASRAADLILWDTAHFTGEIPPGGQHSLALPDTLPDILPDTFLKNPALIEPLQTGLLPLIYASVVPAQTDFLKSYPQAQAITLADIALAEVYPTLGVDRALALWVAGKGLGWPAIVVDGGTALTLTGGNEAGQLVGGAILPGLGLQFRSLFQHTAALPALSLGSLPTRWARNTPDAMRSGIAYTLLAGVESFLEDWIHQYPHTHLCFTGGDGQWLYEHLVPRLRPVLSSDQVFYNSHLALWGLLWLGVSLLQTNPKPGIEPLDSFR